MSLPNSRAQSGAVTGSEFAVLNSELVGTPCHKEHYLIYLFVPGRFRLSFSRYAHAASNNIKSSVQ
jgi:hypothetical protein